LVGDANDGKGPGVVRCDPGLAFDRFGSVHLVYLAPCSASGNVVLLTSSNGGQTFPSSSLRLIAGPADVDRPDVATGPNASDQTQDSVWVSYSQETADSRHIFVRGAAITSTGLGAFQSARQVSDLGGSNIADVAVGPTGQVVIAWTRVTALNGDPNRPITTIYSDRDTDGLGPVGFGADTTVATSNVALDTIPAQPDRAIAATPVIDIARNNGRLYLVYSDEPTDGSDNTDIRLMTSTDYGLTWSAGGAVSDTSARSQFFPYLSVDQTTGNVAVAWYDARLDDGMGGLGDGNGTANDEVIVYGTVSTTAGASFLPSVRISRERSNQAASNSTRDSPNNFGDCIGASYFGGSLFAGWADNSNSTSDNPDGASAGLDICVSRVVLRSADGQLVTATGTNGDDRWDVRPDATGTFTQFFENRPTMTGVPTLTATTAAMSRIDVFGMAGNDNLRPTASVPIRFSAQGGDGDDTLRGGRGDDLLVGGLGRDRLVGKRGADDLRGQDGRDTLEAGAGNDTLKGGNGSDSMEGGTGNDSLDGGAKDDILFGEQGMDVLNGGRDFDSCVDSEVDTIREMCERETL
jgi:hypothetical protein